MVGATPGDGAPRSRAERILAWVWPVIGRPVTLLVERALLSHELVGGDDPLLARSRVFGDPGRLRVDPSAVVNDALFNLSSGTVTVGRDAFFGHGVALITGTHDVTRFGADRQRSAPGAGRDIVVGDGVWLASGATVVGPCRIGEHSVVGAGSLVLDDVEPFTFVAGSPAVVRSAIPRPAPSPPDSSPPRFS